MDRETVSITHSYYIKTSVPGNDAVGSQNDPDNPFILDNDNSLCSVQRSAPDASFG